MTDLPIEEKIDLKDALDRLIKTRQDAADVMIYVSLKWRLTSEELAGQIAMLKLKSKKLILLGRRN